MRRLFTLLILALGVVTLAMAQKKIPREVQFGVLGGANLSQYRFSPTITQNQSVGYTAGVGVRYIEENFFGLQAELLLTRRGVDDRYDSYPQYSYERRFTYIELPVMSHIYFKMGKRNEIAVDMGPKIGFYLTDDTKSKIDADYESLVISPSRHGYKHHDMAVEKTFDYGIQAGLGYEFRLSRELSLQLQGRYYFGLGNIFPDAKGEVFETSSNQSIQIVMSVWFHHTLLKSLGLKK